MIALVDRDGQCSDERVHKAQGEIVRVSEELLAELIRPHTPLGDLRVVQYLLESQIDVAFNMAIIEEVARRHEG